MHLDYRQLLDLLFPRSDDEIVIAKITPDAILDHMSITTTAHATALSSYKDPVIRAAVHLVKYHQHQHATTRLRSLIEHYLQNRPGDICIVPVPLSAARLRQRGYNQVSVVAKQTSLPVHETVLLRHRHTRPQTALTRAERNKNVQQAFTLTTAESALHEAVGKDLILLDDVLTTGATLKAAAAALRPLPYRSLTCVALAH